MAIRKAYPHRILCRQGFALRRSDLEISDEDLPFGLHRSREIDLQLTLELSNVATLPIAIYPGMRIGQLSFYELTTPAEHPYGSEKAGSKYQGQRGPTPSRVYEDF